MSEAAPFDGLRLSGVAVDRGGRPILADVSFDVAAGEAVLVKGPNGAGKTTLLRAVAGLLPLAAGAASVAGSDRPDDRRARTIYCGHSDAAKASLSVFENLRFWARIYGAPSTRMYEALGALGLEGLAATRAGILSAGQRRRLGLARLVISGKRFWLLDEPAASIDAASVGRLIDLVARHCAGGGAALIATHDRLDIPGARAVIVSSEA